MTLSLWRSTVSYRATPFGVGFQRPGVALDRTTATASSALGRRVGVRRSPGKLQKIGRCVAERGPRSRAVAAAAFPIDPVVA